MSDSDMSPGRIHMDINAERWRQHAKWGEQNHPDGTGWHAFGRRADAARAACDAAAEDGTVTWRHIFMEEVLEAMCERNEGRLRKELIQAAAVAVAWIEAIDRRHGGQA